MKKKTLWKKSLGKIMISTQISEMEDDVIRKTKKA